MYPLLLLLLLASMNNGMQCDQCACAGIRDCDCEENCGCEEKCDCGNDCGCREMSDCGNDCGCREMSGCDNNCGCLETRDQSDDCGCREMSNREETCDCDDGRRNWNACEQNMTSRVMPEGCSHGEENVSVQQQGMIPVMTQTEMQECSCTKKTFTNTGGGYMNPPAFSFTSRQ